MIKVRNLSKRYGRSPAVDDLSLTARPGHVLGFLGPNGAASVPSCRNPDATDETHEAGRTWTDACTRNL